MARAKSKIAEVEMWTDRYRIVGEVHVLLRGAYKGRLSDLLNRSRTFPVADRRGHPGTGLHCRTRSGLKNFVLDNLPYKIYLLSEPHLPVDS